MSRSSSGARVSLTSLAVAAADCPYRVAASALSAATIRCPGGALERDAPNPAPVLMEIRRWTMVFEGGHRRARSFL